MKVPADVMMPRSSDKTGWWWLGLTVGLTELKVTWEILVPLRAPVDGYFDYSNSGEKACLCCVWDGSLGGGKGAQDCIRW